MRRLLLPLFFLLTATPVLAVPLNMPPDVIEEALLEQGYTDIVTAQGGYYAKRVDVIFLAPLSMVLTRNTVFLSDDDAQFIAQQQEKLRGKVLASSPEAGGGGGGYNSGAVTFEIPKYDTRSLTPLDLSPVK